MITINRACEIAQAYFAAATGEPGISNILEGPDYYIISNGRFGQMQVGTLMIIVNAADASVKRLRMPSPEGFALLNQASKTDVPKQFRT